jgi:hypothetical protein
MIEEWIMIKKWMIIKTVFRITQPTQLSPPTWTELIDGDYSWVELSWLIKIQLNSTILLILFRTFTSFSNFFLYQARKYVQTSIILFFKRFLRSVINNLVDKKIRSHFADINGIDRRSKIFFDRWGNSRWRNSHYCNKLRHDSIRYLQYFLYLFFTTAETS